MALLNATVIGMQTHGTCNIGAKCCPHSRTGTNGTGSPNVFINGIAAHRLTDTGPCNCPHGGTFESIQASTTVFVNGLGLTRVTDATRCLNCGQPGAHISPGSPDVLVGP